MTVESDKATTQPLPGDGVNKQFDFDFTTYDEFELSYWVLEDEISLQVIDGDVSVVLNEDQESTPGGVVTYPVIADPLTAAQALTIKREMPFTQETLNVASGQSLDAPVVERALDRATLERQELRETLTRSLTVPPGEDTDADYLGRAQAAAEASETSAEESETSNQESQGWSEVSEGFANDSAASAAEAAVIAAELPNSTIRHCIRSKGNGVNIDSTNIKGNEVLSEEGTGAARSIDFTLDMSSGNNEGMVLFKNKDAADSWLLSNTIQGAGKHLVTNTTAAEATDAQAVTSFDTDGCDVGTNVAINTLNETIAEFALQTTHKKVRTFTDVKSVIFDCVDNGGDANYMRIRSIEFYNDGTKLPLTPTVYTTYATTEISPDNIANFAFDTTLSKLGDTIGTEWSSANLTITNQRLIVVFDSVQTFDKVVINNSHATGGAVTRGVENVKIYTSTDAITSTVYGEAIANSENIFNGYFAQHVASNIVDDRGYCGVEWGYSPATGFFMLVYDGDGGQAGKDFPIKNPTGKAIGFCSQKSLSATNSHIVYTAKTGLLKYLLLDTTAAVGSSSVIFKEMSESQLIMGESLLNNETGKQYFSWGFVGDDLGYITPGMIGIEGSSALAELTDGGTFDCGMTESKVQAVIIKRVDSTSNWELYNATDFNKFLELNTTSVENTGTGNVSFSGTNITIDNYTGTHIILIIGKKGDMPSGKTINILASTDNPFVANIADGFDAITGQKDHLVYEDTNTVLSFTESDGNYTLSVDANGDYTLEATRPDFDSTPGVMRGDSDKLPIADSIILNDTIIYLDLMPVGNYYESEWFPADIDTLYELENNFKDGKVKFDLWWNDTPSDEHKRLVTGEHDGTSGFGAYRRVSSESLFVGSGVTNTWHSTYSGDPDASTNGYYKLIVRREW